MKICHPKVKKIINGVTISDVTINGVSYGVLSSAVGVVMYIYNLCFYINGRVNFIRIYYVF